MRFSSCCMRTKDRSSKNTPTNPPVLTVHGWTLGGIGGSLQLFPPSTATIAPPSSTPTPRPPPSNGILSRHHCPSHDSHGHSLYNRLPPPPHSRKRDLTGNMQ